MVFSWKSGLGGWLSKENPFRKQPLYYKVVFIAFYHCEVSTKFSNSKGQTHKCAVLAGKRADLGNKCTERIKTGKVKGRMSFHLSTTGNITRLL